MRLTTITEHLLKCILADISDAENHFDFEEIITHPEETRILTEWRITRNEKTIWLTAFSRSTGIVEDTHNYRNYIEDMKEKSLKELLRQIFRSRN